MLIIKPQIDKEMAMTLLSKPNTFLLRKRTIQKIELVCVPLYIFDIYIDDGKGNKQCDCVSVDGIMGEFAFFKGSSGTLEEIDMERPPEFKISRAQAVEIIKSDYGRLLYRKNMKSASRASVSEISLKETTYYPFWVGYYSIKGSYNFEVIDGINGERQGVKSRRIFIEMILSMNT
jgi:hypothetical protein